MESVPPTSSLADRVAPYRKKLIVLLIALLVIEGVTLVVWSLLSPKYEYSTINMSMFGQQEIRKNKSTGETQIWGAGKWQKIVVSGDQWTLPGGHRLRSGRIATQACPFDSERSFDHRDRSRCSRGSAARRLGDWQKHARAGGRRSRGASGDRDIRTRAGTADAVSPPIDQVVVSSPDAPAAVSPPTEPTAATPLAETTAVPPPAESVRLCPGCGTAYADDEERVCTVCGRARTESV